MAEFNKENRRKTRQRLTLEFLKSDVSILASCFKEFAKMVEKQRELNPLYCVGLAGYNNNCWLKSSGIELVTLQDLRIIKDFEGGLRFLAIAIATVITNREPNQRIDIWIVIVIRLRIVTVTVIEIIVGLYGT